MKKFINEFTAKTVKDAVENAAKELGVGVEEVKYDVLNEGKKGGLFGFGAVDAKISVYEEVEEKEETKTEEKPAKKAEKKEKPAKKKVERKEGEPTDGERAVEFLKGLLKELNLNAEPVLVKEEEKIIIDLKCEKTHDVIGKHGVTIDAIQSLAGAIANIGRDDYKRVVVDCNGYRDRREETLKHVAEKTAEKAVRQGRKISLEPMSAYERRIIHAALANSTEVKTTSEGKEPKRYIVVIPNELKPYSPKKGGYNKKSGRDRDRRDRRESGEKKRQFRQYSEEEKAARSQVGGGTGVNFGGEKKDYSYKKTSSVVFGTFLGNSRDNAPAEKKDEE